MNWFGARSRGVVNARFDGGRRVVFLACVLAVGQGCESGSSRGEWPRSGEAPIVRAVVPGVVGEPDMRIRLGNAISAVSIGTTGSESVWVGGPAARSPARMRPPVAVRLTESRWELTDAAGLVGAFERTGELVLSPVDPSLDAAAAGPAGRGNGATGAAKMPPATPALTLNGARYPGSLRLLPRSDASPRAFDVIEHLEMEEYLKGVVSAELPAQWPVGAFRAQAVAARSYAIHERARSRAAGKAFDVEASVMDQAYKGMSELPQAVQAVRETRGVVLTWLGQPLRAYYSSTAGGRAASARDTWPIGPGYEYNLSGPLQATQRDYAGESSPYNRWTIIRARAELTQRLRAWGRANGHPVKNITALDSIKTGAVNEVGRPTRYLVLQPGGQSYTLPAEGLRQACNTDVEGLPAIRRESRVNSGDMEVSVSGDTVTIKGRGFGHGVGMCQYSAKGLTEKGETWQKILMNFYPGAELKKAY